MTESPGLHFGTVGALSLSVISSVAIVICNKALISTLGFCFGSVAVLPVPSSSLLASVASFSFLYMTKQFSETRIADSAIQSLSAGLSEPAYRVGVILAHTCRSSALTSCIL